jgi:hypothetical protein
MAVFDRSIVTVRAARDLRHRTLRLPDLVARFDSRGELEAAVRGGSMDARRTCSGA